jgi:hypothetical protein
MKFWIRRKLKFKHIILKSTSTEVLFFSAVLLVQIRLARCEKCQVLNIEWRISLKTLNDFN